jgi:hypothetical protein
MEPPEAQPMNAKDKKKEMIAELIASARKYRFCSPSDDLEEVWGVTTGYRNLIIQLKKLAVPILPPDVASSLSAINVEVNDINSALEADSELSVLLPDIEAALDRLDEAAKQGMPRAAIKSIPVPVCSVVGSALGEYYYSHKTLERLFYEAGAVGDVPEGNCITKCQSWLKRMHTEVADPLAILGKVIEEFMEVDGTGEVSGKETGRQKIREVLGRSGLSYHAGGFILGSTNALPTKSLQQKLKDRDLAAVDKEFERSLANVESDPPASITAACAILESLFRIYIEDNGLDLPGEQSLKPLWKTASKHIGFDPSALEDEDIKKILSGMTSVVDGIGSLRTHGSTAHGKGRRPYLIQARHARLAIYASHTLVGFFLETWDERKRRTTQ